MEKSVCTPPAIQGDGLRLAPAASRLGVCSDRRTPRPPRPYDPADHRFPLTFERFFAAAYDQWGGEMVKKPVIHVQVLRRKTVHCARVLKLGDTMDHGQWFKVESETLGIAWAESRSVRLCSGDGRCTCAAAAGKPEAPAAVDQVRLDTPARGRFSQAGVVAPPESLTDETDTEKPDATECPWCGMWGEGFGDSPQPGDYCGHDTAQIVRA